MPSALTVFFRLMAGPMRSGLMSLQGHSRRFDSRPVTSGLPPNNGHHQTGPVGPVGANNGLMQRSIFDKVRCNA
jgi:hypothetical protein